MDTIESLAYQFIKEESITERSAICLAVKHVYNSLGICGEDMIKSWIKIRLELTSKLAYNKE